jgi:hypothetical protein
MLIIKCRWARPFIQSLMLESRGGVWSCADVSMYGPDVIDMCLVLT